ncbi:4Fe-4S binding protein [Candidatus Viridilinea mediisalina]|uniref:4Fe-4S ferredoxin-type domain-containing protein n=1 Tax=Candidatus Viridilinea mediisalina TaxID=2024553 RepID=A0A2A6RLM6_9CHLR|nr:4Fe-4S dicluster domain-containing protein [Candidatus Viridilinea mediisalina]PDW03779.1 hypothetical protein CJ255_06900 [Candidatus Viridilinea mediisalina]
MKARQRPLRQRVRMTILLIAWLLFPVTIFYFSPYLIVQATAEGVVSGSLIVFTLMLLSALLLGRAYCGWACPAAGLQEAALPINPAAVASWLGRIKWVIWSLWMALLIVLMLRAGGYTRIDPFYNLAGGLSINEIAWYPIFLLVNGLALGLAVFAGRRGFCHAICWMAPFMVVGQRLGAALRLPRLRLYTTPSACTGCQVCTRSCPMSLPVHSIVQSERQISDDCILCGNCVDNCKHQAIRFGFGNPARSKVCDLSVEVTK